MERLVILCKSCGDEFVVHDGCYRGHVYCGAACRVAGRQETARAARRRFRLTAEGRADHREAERSRRLRTSVADHRSKNLPELSQIESRSKESDACAKETRSAPRPVAAAGGASSVHRLAHFRVGVADATTVAASAFGTGDAVLVRLAGRACVVCGSAEGRLGFMVARRARGHPVRAARRSRRD